MPGCQRKIEVNGEVLNLKQLSERYARVCYSTVRARLVPRQGYSLIDALTRPLDCTYIRLEGVVKRIQWWRTCGVAYDVECYKEWYKNNCGKVDKFLPGEQVTEYLTILNKVIINNNTLWTCQCKCGNKITARASNLLSGVTVSCGCWHWKWILSGDSGRTHGLSKHPYYTNYKAMVARCVNPDAKGYKDYGGRGIVVCEEWLDQDTGLGAFLAWVDSLPNSKDKGLTLERLDVNGNYCPENCCLATKYEQNLNKRNSCFVWLNGEKLHISKAVERLGISLPYSLVRNRMKRQGFGIADAFSFPKEGAYIPLERVSKNIKDYVARHLRLGNLHLIEGLVPASDRWLTDDQVREIIYRYKVLKEGSKKLSEEFKVNQKTITNVVNGFTRKKATEVMG